MRTLPTTGQCREKGAHIVDLPEKQIISSTPWMPKLLHFTESIEYGLSLRRVRIVIFQTLHEHA